MLSGKQFNQVPLNYPCLRAVLRHSSYEVRRKLAKNVVCLRKLNKILPFHFDQVKLSVEHFSKFSVQIDRTTWVFKTKNWKRFAESSDLWIVNSRGTRLKSSLLDVYALIMYFFTGKTRKINRLVIESFEIIPEVFRVPFVGTLIFNKRLLVAHSLKPLWQTKIDRLVMNIDGSEDDWNNNLSKIKCNSARITTSVLTSSTFFDSIHFPKTEIRESNSSFDKFLNVLKELEKTENLEEYSYCADNIDNGIELWERLKSEYCVEMEHKNFLLINMNGFKILVERWIDCIGSGFAHRVQKVKEGTEIVLLKSKRTEYSPALLYTYLFLSTLNHCFRSAHWVGSRLMLAIYMDIIVPLIIFLKL